MCVNGIELSMKKGRIFMMKNFNVWPTVKNEDFTQKVDEGIHQNRHFMRNFQKFQGR